MNKGVVFAIGAILLFFLFAVEGMTSNQTPPSDPAELHYSEDTDYTQEDPFLFVSATSVREGDASICKVVVQRRSDGARFQGFQTPCPPYTTPMAAMPNPVRISMAANNRSGAVSSTLLFPGPKLVKSTCAGQWCLEE